MKGSPVAPDLAFFSVMAGPLPDEASICHRGTWQNTDPVELLRTTKDFMAIAISPTMVFISLVWQWI